MNLQASIENIKVTTYFDGEPTDTFGSPFLLYVQVDKNVEAKPSRQFGRH